MKRFYSIFISMTMILIFGLSIVVTAFSTPLFTPIIITFGNSPQEEVALNTIITNYPGAEIISYTNIHDLLNALTLMRSYSPLILIGHGSKEGIIGGNGHVISWNELGKWINTLPSTFVYFLSCYSLNAGKYVKVKSFGFSNFVDAVLGGIIVAANLLYNDGKINAVNKLQNEFSNYVSSLLSGKSKLLLLGVNNYYVKVFDDISWAEEQLKIDYTSYTSGNALDEWQDIIIIVDPENVGCTVAKEATDCLAFQLTGTGIGNNKNLKLDGRYFVFTGNDQLIKAVLILAGMNGYLMNDDVNPYDHFQKINQGTNDIGNGSCGWNGNDIWNCIQDLAKSISSNWQVVAVLIAAGVIVILVANSLDTFGLSDLAAIDLGALVTAFLLTAPASATNAYNNGLSEDGLNYLTDELINLAPKISIISPYNGSSYYNPFTFSVSVSTSTNDLYSTNYVYSISLYIDGSSLTTTSPGTNTASVTIYPNSYSTGTHLLTVKTLDYQGNDRSATIQVTFVKPPPPPPPGSGCSPFC